jgi:L-fucose isomerase-like protein
MIDVLTREGFDIVALEPADTKYGSVESLDDARTCAALFARERERLAGVVVTLPNFGDERAIANVLRWADLGVPVLVQAFPDDAAKMLIADRRDAFCGKMSACNNLLQYGIKFSLTRTHTVDPTSAEFAADLQQFAATCRVVRGLRHARFGALGARPTAFNTVRYSEKLLERSGISVETLDLSELFGRARRLASDARLARSWRASAASCPRPTRRTTRSTRWRAWRRHRPVDGRTPASWRPRCSAGPPWKSITAWCPAP